MSQASKQNETSERFMGGAPRTASPAPRFESRDGTAAPRYRIPTAPERQPQSASPNLQREYRGTGSASSYAAPEARSAPPRAENVAPAQSRGEAHSAPRNEGGSNRSSGGGSERAPQHHSGGNGGGRDRGGRDGESRSHER